MPNIELSAHAKHMVAERDLLEEWVWRTINAPDGEYLADDSNAHYTKAIQEREGRIVTVFFDRRLGKKRG